MLEQAHARGVADALSHYGIKTAQGFMSGLAQNLIGTPGRLFVQGPSAFRSGGPFSMKNVFWPDVKGPSGTRWNWIPRANTLMMPLAVRSMMQTDPPDERAAPRMLGAIGGVIGGAYGHQALGMLGGPLAAAAGHTIGRGVGNLIS